MSQSLPVDIKQLPPNAAGKSVFFTGLTGYIGGTVFTKLLALPTPPTSITALIRDSKKAEKLSELTLPAGTTLTPLIGSLQDLDKIRDAVAEADIVVSTADADDLPAVKAMLEGMKIRKEKTGHRTLFIHTSGTGVLTDDARGMYPSDRTFTDLNPTPAHSKGPALLSMATLPETAPHRVVDIQIVIADASAICKSYIVLPSTIWGEGKGQIFDLGISNPLSVQMPTLIRAALDRGQAGMVGEGANIWPHVNISDIGDLFIVVYVGALQGNIGHGTSGYYLGTTGEYTLFAAASAIGSALYDLKLAQSAQPKSFTPEELDKYYGGNFYSGTNSRGKSARSKMIGWKPVYTDTEVFLKDLKEEVLRVDKKFGRSFGSLPNKV